MKKRVGRIHRTLQGDRGQVLILFMAILTITMAMGVISVDLGLWLSDRRSAVKAADLAALAGSQDLPASVSKAHESALDWAKRNGWDDSDPDVTVTVTFFCSNTLAQSMPGICHKANPSSPDPEPCSVGTLNDTAYCDSIKVTVKKPGTHIFSSFFGMGDINEGSAAMAALSFDLMPLDTVMVLDRTLSMSGTPLAESKDAAKRFTDILLPDGGSAAQTRVGVAPYSNCYKPPYTSSDCTLASWVIPLTNDKDSLEDGIDAVTANGSTNICLGLYKGNQTILPSGQPDGTDTRRIVVLLSDGQNNYMLGHDGTATLPPQACRPNTNPSVGDPYPSDCHAAQTRQRELDVKTKTLVDQMKVNGVEVYVVGFGVCGAANNNLCNPGMIGTNTHDNTANRNFLKCLASSTPGTNDHYFEVPTASQLPQIFSIIAWKIAGRALTQ